MDLKELEETDIWTLYAKCKNFMYLRGIYTDTDKNFRFYNGNQWEGLKIEGIEPVSFNFIKPIVKYKVSNVTANLYAANYSAENIDNMEFRETADEVCELLNLKASKVFDKDFLDLKIKKWVKQAAINDESVAYVYYNEELDLPINEIISKNDIMYGNENEEEIQLQPYILLRHRKPVIDVIETARKLGFKDEDLEKIKGDKETETSSGESAKYELDDMVTVITKMYRKDGTIHFSESTRYLILKEDKDTGLSLYPVEHLNWEDQEGNARGIGEVRQLIPNQIETNKTAMRRLLTVKNTAYPQKVVNIDAIQNKSALNRVGGTIEFKSMGSNLRASDVFMNTSPAQMSTDSITVQNELITNSRELAGAGENATGEVDPTQASGKAILAVQQAQQQPLTEHLTALKTFLEGLARIWLDMWKVYAREGLKIETEEQDPMTQEMVTVIKEIPSSVLEELQASVKIDITPKGAFDKYAQELSLENMFTADKITFEEYVESLDPDSVMPKVKLEKILKKRQEAQKKIADIDQQALQMKMQAQQSQASASDINAIAQTGDNLISQALQSQQQTTQQGGAFTQNNQVSMDM